MTMSDDQRHGNGYMGGFVMGAFIGAAAVFFLGTKKGKRLAKVMHKQGGKTLKDLESLVTEIEVKGEKFAQDAQVITKKLEKRAKSTQKEVTKTAKKQLGHIKQLQEKGRAAATRYFKKGGKNLK